MREAALGSRSKRAPVEIEATTDGQLIVVDGNSTLINALYSNWPDRPCRLKRKADDKNTGEFKLELEEARSIVTDHLDE